MGDPTWHSTESPTPARSPISIDVVPASTPQRVLQSVDLSPTGMFVRCEDPMPPGSSVSFDLRIPSTRGFVTAPASGHVTWRNLGAAPCKPTYPAGMGVSIEWAQAATTAALAELVAARERFGGSFLLELTHACESSVARTILDAVDDLAFVLNAKTQILSANARAIEALNLTSEETLLGRRPGDVLGCVNASRSDTGCGGHPSCRPCEVRCGLLGSDADAPPISDEWLLARRETASRFGLEFRTRCLRIRDGQHEFSVLILKDVGDSKRRDMLERVFLHDLLNTITGLKSWSTLVSRGSARDVEWATTRISVLADTLTSEVRSYQLLVEGERGNLQIDPAPHTVGSVLATIEAIFANHPAAAGKRLSLHQRGQLRDVVTDATLLVRVITNMVKNALEATAPQGEVTVTCIGRAECLNVDVHNDGVIPPDVARNIFKRSFSTKGPTGRGLGTYSMKLFAEVYLGGAVSFDSSPDRGTVFRVALPWNAR